MCPTRCWASRCGDCGRVGQTLVWIANNYGTWWSRTSGPSPWRRSFCSTSRRSTLALWLPLSPSNSTRWARFSPHPWKKPLGLGCIWSEGLVVSSLRRSDSGQSILGRPLLSWSLCSTLVLTKCGERTSVKTLLGSDVYVDAFLPIQMNHTEHTSQRRFCVEEL